MKGFLVIALVLFAFGVCLAEAQPQPAGADTAKSYKPCPKCRVANFPDARFCFSCGAPFEPGTVSAALPESAWADSTRCPACRAERLPQAEFCSNCGASFSTGRAAERAPLESGPKKEPGIALCLSLLIPGAGQVYNGQPAKGILFLGGYLAGWGMLVKGFADSWNSGGSKGDEMALIGLVLGGVAYVGSVIDAPVSAGNLNRRRGYSSLSSPGVGLVFVPDPRNPRRLQPGFGLRAGF